MKKDYSKLADLIIENVGGKENIISVSNCMTRLRLNLKDDSICNDDVISSDPLVSGVGRNNGQYQIIIGLDVPNFRKVVDEKLNLVEKPKEKFNFFGIMAKVMSPILPYLIASGIITGVIFLYMMAASVFGWSLVPYTFFNAAGNALLYFFPFFLAYNLANAIDLNPILGLVLAGIMCHPTINGVDLTIFGITFNNTYTSTFIPILFVVYLAKPVYNFIEERLPVAIRSFTAPMLTMIIVGTVGFFAIGPVINYLAQLVTDTVLTIYDFSPIICGIILGGTFEVLVMFGLHGLVGLISMNNIIAGKPDILAGLLGFATFSCMFMALALYIKTKNKNEKSGYLGMFISSVFGVTEPIIYGAIIPNMKLFIPVCISSAIGGAMAGFFNLAFISYTGMGVIGLLSYVNPNKPMAIVEALITLAIVCASSFVITLVIYKDKKETGRIIKSVAKGKRLSLDDINDETFRQELLGKVAVIESENNTVYAPFNGTVKMLFPTKHAIGLVSDNGEELMIHVGVDTVKLDGKYFESYVEQGNRVKQGDKLLTFDAQAIKEAGYSSEVIVVFTNSKDYKNVTVSGNDVLNEDDAIFSW